MPSAKGTERGTKGTDRGTKGANGTKRGTKGIERAEGTQSNERSKSNERSGERGERLDRRRTLREAQQGVRQATEQLRSRVCTGPKYPGRPEDYTYVLSESCRPKQRRLPLSRTTTTARPHAPTDATGEETNETSIPTRQTRSEIQGLERALAVEPPPPPPRDAPTVDRDWTGLVVNLFNRMILPAERRRRPDPLLRYKALVDGLEQRYPKNADTIADIPRHMILRLTLVHLRATLDDAGRTKPAGTKKM